MNLSPGAIAVQGLGYGPLLVALQGLWDVGGQAPARRFRHRNMAFRPNAAAVEQSEPKNDDQEVVEIVHAFMALRRVH